MKDEYRFQVKFTVWVCEKEIVKEMYDWLSKNVIWHAKSYSIGIIGFTNPEHAMRFKLVWGDYIDKW